MTARSSIAPRVATVKTPCTRLPGLVVVRHPHADHPRRLGDVDRGDSRDELFGLLDLLDATTVAGVRHAPLPGLDPYGMTPAQGGRGGSESLTGVLDGNSAWPLCGPGTRLTYGLNVPTSYRHRRAGAAAMFSRPQGVPEGNRGTDLFTLPDNEKQPVSRTLLLERGSCSQRLAVLEAVGRACGIAGRVRGLLVNGRFWYPRFPRLRALIPHQVVLAWPEFLLDDHWVTVSELYGDLSTLQKGGGFTNTSGETLFDAVVRTAVDWDGATCSSCDLSGHVLADLGYFSSRDALFRTHGQTLCLPTRIIAGPHHGPSGNPDGWDDGDGKNRHRLSTLRGSGVAPAPTSAEPPGEEPFRAVGLDETRPDQLPSSCLHGGR